VQLAAKPWRKEVALAGAYKIEEASRPSPEPDIYFRPHRLGVRSAPRGNQMIRFLCKVRRPSSTNLRETRDLSMANDEEIQEGRIDLAPMVDVASIAARFYGGLYRFAVSQTKRESDAADLAQQTFLILT
jgi:hypothetical protein